MCLFRTSRAGGSTITQGNKKPEIYPSQDDYISFLLFQTKASEHKRPRYLCHGEVGSNLFLLNRMVPFFSLLGTFCGLLFRGGRVRQPQPLMWDTVGRGCGARGWEVGCSSPSPPAKKRRISLFHVQVIVRIGSVEALGNWIKNIQSLFSAV